MSLTYLPEVSEAVRAARQACDALRWHPGLRRRAEEARAESMIRAASASAAIEGARLPVDLVRDGLRGVRDLPSDAAGRLVRGAVRAALEGEAATPDQVATAGGHGTAPTGPRTGPALWQRSPSQLLARLHTAAATGWLDDAELGRPRAAGIPTRDLPGLGAAPDGEALAERLTGVTQLLARPTGDPDGPAALVVAAVVHAEVMVIRPFAAGNGVVARALARVVTVGRGLDPTGVAVPEVFWRDRPAEYAKGIRGYAGGDLAGVVAWIRACGDAVVRGAQEGERVADAILAGRPGD